MQAKHVQVLVRRDMAEVISTTVFEHEVEILRDIHGAGNVELVESYYPTIEIDEGEEFDRLMTIYGKNDNGQPYVERVIGYSARHLAEFKAEAEAPKRGRKTKAEE